MHVEAWRFSLKADLLRGLNFFMLCLHLYSLLCCPTVSPGTAQVPATPKRCFCSNSLLKAAVDGRDTGTTAIGEAGGSISFNSSSSCTFPHLSVCVFFLLAWKTGLELPCKELQEASGCPPSQPTCSCWLGHADPESMHLLIPEVFRRGQGLGTTCALCNTVPRGQSSDALPQHRHFTRSLCILVHDGAPSSPPSA